MRATNNKAMNNKSIERNSHVWHAGRWIMLLIGITAAVVIGVILLSCTRHSNFPVVNLITNNGTHIRIN